MSNRPGRLLPFLVLSCLVPRVGSSAEAHGVETLERAGGERQAGRLAVDTAGGFVFRLDGSARELRLEPGMTIRFPGQGPGVASGLPPFRVELGLDQRLAGRLESLSAREIVLLDAAGEPRVAVSRSGAQALVQRPGETLAWHDGFETLDSAHWVILGEPEVVASPKLSGGRALKLPGGGSSLTYRVADPIASGRLDMAFHDDGVTAAGHTWFVDLTFRSSGGPETVRTVLGWAEETLAVESPGGPALAVQRLARSAGWHRLNIRFGSDSCEVGVDGDELAHGRGLGGPLVEVRLATASTPRAEVRDDLAGSLDDLRLVRFAEPGGDLEVDVSQDELRMTGGDQVFGRVKSADSERIEAVVDRADVPFSWSEVSGLYFRRAGTMPGVPVSGLLVRAEWRSAPGKDPRDVDRVEGALTAVSPTTLTIATPYCGILHVPRARLTSLSALGRGTRLVIDPSAHHLGDNVSTAPPFFDPPQPEGGVLERVADLDVLPSGPAFLVLDLVQVVGETAEIPIFSDQVKKGELRTNVALNGQPFDYINRHVVSKNETPERIRIPLPKGLLKPGRNVIRFEQVGEARDPNSFDDLGLLGLALEFDTPAPAAEAKRP